MANMPSFKPWSIFKAESAWSLEARAVLLAVQVRSRKRIKVKKCGRTGRVSQA